MFVCVSVCVKHVVLFCLTVIGPEIRNVEVFPHKEWSILIANLFASVARRRVCKNKENGDIS